MSDLKSLDAELAKDSMRGLWAREEAIRREPVPFGKPMLWKWAKIRAGLEAAGQLITTNYKGRAAPSAWFTQTWATARVIR